MRRIGGLDHHLPRRRAASRTPRHLRQQLVGPLRGPKIGVVQQVIGIEDPDERHALEIEPFGNHLRTDQNIGAVRREIADDGAEGALRGDRIAVQPRHARLGKAFGNLLLDLLRAEAHRLQLDHLARGAAMRRRLRMAAIVADELFAPLVVGERHVALGAARRPAALGALEVGGEAAPVLEKHHLLAARQRRIDPIEQLLVEMAVTLVAPRRPPNVRQHDRRGLRRAVALRQFGASVFARRGVEPRFERGGGAAEQGTASRLPCQPDGDIAGRIARGGFRLLVARIVLLVDDHQPEPLQRQKDRRADPDDEGAPRGAIEPQVGLRTAAVGQARVVGRHAAAEDALHALDELRRQGDFGYQQQHVLPRRQPFGDQVDVDFGLARPRDAVQQRRGAPFGPGAPQGVEGLLLVRRQAGQAETGLPALDVGFVFALFEQPLAAEGVQRRAVGRQQTARNLARAGCTRIVCARAVFAGAVFAGAVFAGAVFAHGGCHLQQRGVLLRRTPFEAFEAGVECRLVGAGGRQGVIGFGAGAEIAVGERFGGVGRGFHEGGERTAHHLAEGAEVVIGHPLPKGAAPLVEQRTVVETPLDALDALHGGTAVVQPPDDARIVFAGAELDRDDLSLRHGHLLGNGERIGRLGQREHDIGKEGHGRIGV